MRRFAVLVVLWGLVLVAPAHAVTRHRCGGAVCGTLKRPLGNGRTIEIAYRWYKGSGGPPIVAVEGGPGYPSTGSRVEYRGTFGPLGRDLLLVDNRGTGDSGLINCPGVQRFAGRTSGPAFAARAAGCARQIDRKFGRGAHALFATAYAVDDLAAVIRALGFPRVDLYGDSYGSWFVQDFAARHPELLHSLILDSTYPRHGLDPWYASSAATMRSALEIVSPGSVARLGALLARGGARRLSDLVQDAGSDPVIYRE